MSDPRQEFERAIDELRFGDARKLIDEFPEDDRPALQAALRSEHEEAIEEAELFANRIQLLAREDHYFALYELTTDPMTSRRLHLLAKEIRRGAEIHLNGAERRREQSLGSARRHMDRAEQLLDEFHTGNARSALARVDETWLEEEDRTRLVALRDRLEAVKAESEELSSLSEEIIAEHGPVRTRRSGGGCLSAVLAITAIIATLVLLLG